MKRILAVVAALVLASMAVVAMAGNFDAPVYGVLTTTVWTATYTNTFSHRVGISAAFISGIFPTNNTASISFCNTPAQTNLLVYATSTSNTLGFVDAGSAVPLDVGGKVIFYRSATNTIARYSLFTTAD